MPKEEQTEGKERGRWWVAEFKEHVRQLERQISRQLDYVTPEFRKEFSAKDINSGSILVMISTKQADEITQRKFKMVKKKKKKHKTVHQETKLHTVIR